MVAHKTTSAEAHSNGERKPMQRHQMITLTSAEARFSKGQLRVAAVFAGAAILVVVLALGASRGMVSSAVRTDAGSPSAAPSAVTLSSGDLSTGMPLP
jgi:hypothetical protein